MNLNLQNKVVLVTGSHRGTGAVIAKQFASEGARVIIQGPDQDGFAQAGDDAFDAHRVWGDLATDAGAELVFEQAISAFGVIDILVNNFGQADAGSWWNTSSEKWIDIYQVNVLSAARMIQHVVPQMKQLESGRVIQLGTIGSIKPNSKMPHYYASKGALANMTASLAKELSGTGITVNTVSPGLIRTPEMEASFRKKARAKGWGEDWASIEAAVVKEMFPNPTGRIATREDIADLVMFLASDRAGFINGQNVRIDGGSVDIV
ncbi:MAG: SDR family oxidoreductase [Pseudomonadales bacterium]|nr:SDR family oxidoreductase [Pseudomonadales bacterium]